MSGVQVLTSRFGELTIAKEKIVTFVDPILGFPEYVTYVLLDHAEDSPFQWLQSTQEPELAFVVTHPRTFGIEYQFEIPESICLKLQLTQAEDSLVMTVVTIPEENPAQMTANLMGPLVINQATMQAVQLVLGDSGYSTKHRLIPQELLSQQPALPAGAERNA